MENSKLTAPPPTASGSHTRVQLQRVGQVLTLHGTIVGYDPVTGVFQAMMDYQVPGQALELTPMNDPPPTAGSTAPPPRFRDQNGLDWTLVR